MDKTKATNKTNELQQSRDAAQGAVTSEVKLVIRISKLREKLNRKYVTPDENGYWPAIEILDEDLETMKVKVRWEGLDPDTDRPWSPTWEYKANCSPALVMSWIEKQEQIRLKKEKAENDADYEE